MNKMLLRHLPITLLVASTLARPSPQNQPAVLESPLVQLAVVEKTIFSRDPVRATGPPEKDWTASCDSQKLCNEMALAIAPQLGSRPDSNEEGGPKSWTDNWVYVKDGKTCLLGLWVPRSFADALNADVTSTSTPSDQEQNQKFLRLEQDCKDKFGKLTAANEDSSWTRAGFNLDKFPSDPVPGKDFENLTDGPVVLSTTQTGAAANASEISYEIVG